MDRGSEGSAAPQISEGGLGFPASPMLCRRHREGDHARKWRAEGYSVGLSFMR